jgi:hypothetical protein
VAGQLDTCFFSPFGRWQRAGGSLLPHPCACCLERVKLTGAHPCHSCPGHSRCCKAPSPLLPLLHSWLEGVTRNLRRVGDQLLHSFTPPPHSFRLQSWLEDVTRNQSRIADQLLQNVYRWLSNPASKLHDPGLHEALCRWAGSTGCRGPREGGGAVVTSPLQAPIAPAAWLAHCRLPPAPLALALAPPSPSPLPRPLRRLLAPAG